MREMYTKSKEKRDEELLDVSARLCDIATPKSKFLQHKICRLS